MKEQAKIVVRTSEIKRVVIDEDDGREPDWLGQLREEYEEGAILDKGSGQWFVPEDPEYGQEDLERWQAWQMGHWWMTGIYAKVDVVVCGVRQVIRTAGLYGIESDCGEEYKAEIFAEERGALVNILRALGVEVLDDVGALDEQQIGSAGSDR